MRFGFKKYRWRLRLPRQLSLGLSVLVIGLTFAGCAQPHQFNGTAFEDPPAAFAFEGTNYDGTPFRMSEQQGKVVLIFFGYTFCPDICPLTLADLKRVSTQLGDQAADLAIVFVTVDPERDTPAQMATYVRAFDPGFYGVRLEGEMFEATKKAYGVYVEKRAAENGDAGHYLVDHTGAIYVIDKAGNLSETFSYDAGAEAMLPDVAYWLKQ